MPYDLYYGNAGFPFARDGPGRIESCSRFPNHQLLIIWTNRCRHDIFSMLTARVRSRDRRNRKASQAPILCAKCVRTALCGVLLAGTGRQG